MSRAPEQKPPGPTTQMVVQVAGLLASEVPARLEAHIARQREDGSLRELTRLALAKAWERGEQGEDALVSAVRAVLVVQAKRTGMLIEELAKAWTQEAGRKAKEQVDGSDGEGRGEQHDESAVDVREPG